jgi:hypothetical protein
MSGHLESNAVSDVMSSILAGSSHLHFGRFLWRVKSKTGCRSKNRAHDAAVGAQGGVAQRFLMLEDDFEELDALPLSGVGIDDYALLG